MSKEEIQIGYCTNIHAGASLEEVVSNIQQYSVPVKQAISPDQPFGVGLWFGAESAEKLAPSLSVWEMRDFLVENGLVPFTFNGFPFGDFHEDVVKRNVYLPTWADDKRFMYTVRLAKIQSELLPEGSNGSISTLPLGWPVGGYSRTWTDADNELVEKSASNLRDVASILKKLYEHSERKIRIAIEPEPGCILDNFEAVEKFFTEFLLTGNSENDDVIRDYIGICHDVCHSAVMFESQREAIESYTKLGLRVVKVQVSSAIEVRFDEIDGSEHEAALKELKQFEEPRYLHQVCIKGQDGQVDFFEDLGLALKAHGKSPQGTWRIHFHVPIFLEKFQDLNTTQAEITECWKAMRELQPECTHFEVETYAWDVMADEFKSESLVESIVKELNWFRSLIG